MRIGHRFDAGQARQPLPHGAQERAERAPV